MRRSRVHVGLLVVLLAAGLLGACSRAVTGTGTPPPRASDLLTRTVATMKALPGFAVSTRLTIGDDTATSQYRLQGDDGTGTLTVNGSTAEARRVDGQVFGRADAAFWRGQGVADADAVTLDGRWTTVPEQSALARGFEAAAYYRSLTDDPELARTPVRADSVAGVRVWVLGEQSPTAAIAADGPPRLVRLGFGTEGSIDLTYPTDELQVAKPDDVVAYPG